MSTAALDSHLDSTTLDPRLGRKTASFISQKHHMYIGGEFVAAASGKTFPVHNPATGDVMAHVPEAESEDVDRAVDAARKAFDEGPWSAMTPSRRGKLIWKLADLLEQNLEEFAEIESMDNGKPLSVARIADVPMAVDVLRYMSGWSTKIMGQTSMISFPGNFLAYTVREPVGVVGQIIPWNFPLLMAAWKLGPALAAGCTVVLKLAEQTPLSGLRLAELIHEAGFPDGVVNVLAGYGEGAGAPLAAHPLVDKVAFTGSTEVGRQIVRASAGNLKKVTLELGGKSPAIVFPDADLELAIPGVASAIFFNHGQVCCAGSRLFVHESIFDKVVEGVSGMASRIRLGNGLDPQTEMGPLVSQEQCARVSRYVESSREQGAKVEVGGKRAAGRGYFMQPTVLTRTTPEMEVVREEIFGPVVCAVPFSNDDLDGIAREANNTEYGLAASVWTRDISVANKMARRIRSGTVWINCHNVFDAALPFGGYKQSGWGREMGAEGLNIYTELKSVVTAL